MSRRSLYIIILSVLLGLLVYYLLMNSKGVTSTELSYCKYNLNNTGYLIFIIGRNNARVEVVKIDPDDYGNIAVGSWFIDKNIPLSKRISLSVDIKINKASNISGWVRVALVCAVNFLGKTLYTELDIWDSPYIKVNDKVVYKGGNVIELKYDQIIIGEWKRYTINFTECILKAWGSNVLYYSTLESIYLVIEFDRGSLGSISIDIRGFEVRI